MEGKSLDRMDNVLVGTGKDGDDPGADKSACAYTS